MFQKFIVPYIVPLIVLSRVVPEVKSVSELKIGIELLKLSNPKFHHIIENKMFC